MANFGILYRPESLDNNIEIDLIEAETNKQAMFRWLSIDENNNNHFSGYINEAISLNDAELYKNDYSEFKKKHYKPNINFI